MSKAAFTILLMLGAMVHAKPTRFEVKDAAFRNTVQWISDAALERTVATTHFISGWVQLDVENLEAGIQGEIEVDTRAFHIGPESKQLPFRGLIFDSAQHPMASFRFEQWGELSGNKLAPGQTVTGSALGRLTLKGQPKEHTAKIRVVYWPESTQTKRRLPGNLLKVTAQLDAALNAYKITIPKALEGLVASSIRVTADFVGTDQIPAVNP